MRQRTRLRAAAGHGADSAAGSRGDLNRAVSLFSFFLFVTRSQKREGVG